MKTLAIQDMRQHAASWLWTLVVAMVGSASVAGIIAVALAAWRQVRTAEDEVVVQAVTGNVVCFTVLAGCAVVASTAGQVVRARAREHALWKAVGVPGRTIGRVVLAQLAVVGALGGLLGIVMVGPLSRWVASQWQRLGVETGTSLSWWGAAATAPVLGSLLCLAGGLPVARRAGRVRELDALREAAQPRARIGVVRWVTAGVLLLGLASLPALMMDSVRQHPDFAELQQLPPHLLGSAASMMVMMVALVLAPWTLRLAMAAVTRVPLPGVTWRVAGRTAQLRAATSTTMTFPFALAMAVVGVCHGTGNLVTGEVQIAEITVAFGLVFLVCWVGGVANIAMLARTRSRDAALLASTGARPHQVSSVVALEGVLHAASAWFFAAVLTTLGLVLTGMSASMSWGDALARGPWALLGGMGLVTLLTTTAAVVLPAVHEGRRATVARLRVVG